MTALADRLRRATPIGGLSDESASSWRTPPAPHCPNRDRPSWLLSKWHCAQDHDLDGRYGLRCEDYWRLFEAQGGRCALCGGQPRRYRLVVHHTHQPPYEIPCLLHFTCNRLIDALLWLVPRLLRIMLDPPGRPLGLRVPAAKARRLEAKDAARRRRAAAKRALAKATPPTDDEFGRRVQAALEQTTDQGG